MTSDILGLFETDAAMYLFFGVQVALIVLSAYLYSLLRGSPFAPIPLLLLVSGVSLMVHAMAEIWLPGQLKDVLYAATSVVAAICILWLLLRTRAALSSMISTALAAGRDKEREAA